MKTDDLFSRFLEIIDTLEKEKVDYVLIGGFAMVLYGMPRATQDIDIFIKHREENIERLQKALFTIFNNKDVFEITFSEFKKYPVIRYGAEEGYYVDILANIESAFSFEDLIFEELTIEGHKIKIASVETLYKLKEKTLRAIDKSDILFLKQLMKNKQ